MAVVNVHHYAQIDTRTGKCIGAQTTSDEIDNTIYPEAVKIPVYDEHYVRKYYINGNWYEDAAGTIIWTSSLLNTIR